MSIKQQAAKSVLWSAVERFSVQGIQFVLGILIARLLLPSDYGLVAMLGIFMAVAQTFIDSGFANALIQKKDRTNVDYSTTFYFNFAVSLVVYVLLYVSAPFIADFYKEEQLTLVTRVMGVVLIINSLGIVQQAKLTIALDFKRQAVASLIAVIISGGIGLWMAYAGYGVWTLVWQSLLNNVFRVILLWIYSAWKPELCFSVASFKSLFSFGSKLLLSSLLHTIYTNLYTLVIGKKFLAADLGFFNRADTLARFPSTNLTNVIVRAVYPIQCKMQDDDEQLRVMFLKYMRMACYLIFPVMIGLCALSEPLVKVILGEKWLPAVPLLQILCIAYMWDPVMKINHNMLNVKGRSDYFLYAEIIKKIAAFAILVLSIPFGILIMCAGLILYSLIDIIIIVFYTRKLTGISLLAQCKELLPVTFLAFTMGGVSYAMTLLSVSSLAQLFLGFFVGTTYYIFISKLLHFNEYSYLYGILKRRIR